MKEHEKQNNGPRRVTYSDIAEALGISKMTVSYAMRNDPRIPEATRRRVQEKAEELHYQRDPLLSALSTYRHGSGTAGNKAALAWINLCRQPDKLREQKVFSLYWEGAYHAAHELGYHLEEFRWSELPLPRMHSILKARGIRGIVLAPTPPHESPSPDQLQAFPWQDYAVVRFGESLRALNVNFVSSAQVSNTILAFEQIQQRGYRRIGFAGQYLRHRLFSAGYLWAQQALPRSRQLRPLFLPDEPAADRTRQLASWLEKQQPDAIICSAPGLLQMLQQLGRRIPEEIGLASMSRHDNPIDAGINQKAEAIGRTAVQSLVSQLNENSFGFPEAPKEILVEGCWTDGPMLPRRR